MSTDWTRHTNKHPAPLYVLRVTDRLTKCILAVYWATTPTQLESDGKQFHLSHSLVMHLLWSDYVRPELMSIFQQTVINRDDCFLALRGALVFWLSSGCCWICVNFMIYGEQTCHHTSGLLWAMNRLNGIACEIQVLYRQVLKLTLWWDKWQATGLYVCVF